MIERAPLGDPHFGKAVELVTEDNKKYLFKPRSSRVERAFEAFLLKLEQKGFPFVPACEHVFESGDDWFKSEFVVRQSAETEEEAARYFKSCGALVFLAYLLCSTDLHMENIVASRTKPVVVDCETLMSGTPDKPQSTLRGLVGSVTDSHLLPVIWQFDGGKYLQTSGLFANVPDSRNMLILNGAPCAVYDYENELLCGFEAGYRFTVNNKEFVRDSLSLFEGCRFRILLRPTQTYSKLAELAGKFPEDKRRTAAEMLLSVAYQNDIRENRLEYMRSVLDCETEAVARGDIPHFTVEYDSNDLFCGEKNVREGFLALSPSECVHERLSSLCESDLSSQKKIITQIIASVRPIDKRVFVPIGDTDEIEALFSILENGCIERLSAGWIHLEAARDNNLYIQNVGFGLYSGLLGILCAYAAFYRKTGDKKFLDSLMKRYEPFADFLNGFSGTVNLDDHAGCLQDGVGGMINTLLHLHDLTGCTRFFDDAAAFARRIVPASGEGCGDLLGGAAGFALMLPKLSRDISAPVASALLPRLLGCTPTLTGAAHGAAGLALAVAAAQNALDTREYDNKIISLLDFEEQYYNNEKHNWQDLRHTDKTAFMNGWCSGAGGEAMTRKRILELTDNSDIRRVCLRDIDRAKENLLSDTVLKRDSLCCGNASRVMALSNLGIGGGAAYDALRRLELNMVHINDTCDINYGLMQGIAGVGYALAMNGDELSGGMLL